MTNKNLSLWELVEKTDILFTKKAKKGARSFTSITPMSQFREATKVFGPIGLGWGIEPESEKFITETHGASTLLHYDAILFYKFNGETGRLPVHSSVLIAYQTQGSSGNAGYFKVDDDARKKVATNAKTKGLSELGFNADVFLGMHDDSEYISELSIEISDKKSADQEAKQFEKMNEVIEYTKQSCLKIMESENKPLLNLLYKEHESVIKRKCNSVPVANEKYIAQIQQAYKEMLDKFENK